jgi:hypothetical protein
MRGRIRAHLTYANVISTLCLFLVLSGGVVYAANGDFLILGQGNSASKPTRLSSGNATNALRVTDTGGGAGVWASGGQVGSNTAAIHGESAAGNAVEGFSTANPSSGVYGQDNNANSYGVAGHSDNGVAVVGDSSGGWAMQALGNTSQTRSGNGFVKAMALVDGFDKTDGIRQCFNSQLPPSQATSGDCGLTYTRSAAGEYDVDFGFRVNDRFVLTTGQNGFDTIATSPVSSTTMFVSAIDNAAHLTDSEFWIFVF